MPIPVLTHSEIKDIEARNIASGYTEYDMILSAGEAVFETLKTMLEEESLSPPFDHDHDDEDPNEGPEIDFDKPEMRGPVVAFVCGKGKNGADALATALLAAQAQYPLVIYQLYSDKPYAPEVERFRQQVHKAGLTINSIKSPLDLPVFQDIDIIVDGLLGTGTNREPEGLIQSCIFGMNQSGIPILSIDIPSGIRCDDPQMSPSTIQATATVCLSSLKISTAFYPASYAYGKIGYSHVGLDEKMLANEPSQLQLYSMEDALEDLPPRLYTSHKYTSGKVLIIAGSRGMHGAAALAANAALRAGAGLVRLAVPGGIYTETAAHILEIIGIPCGEKSYCFSPEHISELREQLEWADSILIGPGLGKAPVTQAFLVEIFPLLKGRKVVFDGDALFLFGESYQLDIEGCKNFILTPHAGEYKRLGGSYIYEQPLLHSENLRAFSLIKNLHIALKGPTMIVAEPAGKINLLPIGNPGLATAGTGDVLAGIIAAFFMHLPTAKAACLGAFTHGKAGHLARNDQGTLGLAASDLLLYIALALRDIEDEAEDSGQDRDLGLKK